MFGKVAYFFEREVEIEIPSAPEAIPIPEPPSSAFEEVEDSGRRVAAGRRVAPGTRKTLRVDVVDPWGRPVPNVEVVATRLDAEEEDKRFPVHYAGTCEIDLLVGVPYRLEAIPGSPWFERGGREPVRVEQRKVRIRLAMDRVRVSGTFRRVDAARPETGVQLRWTKVGETGEGGGTGCGEAFDVLVPAGDVLLEASRRGWTGVEFVTGRAGDWRRDVEILLHTPLLAEVVGSVVDSQGLPVPGAELNLLYSGGDPASPGGRGSSEAQSAGQSDERGRFVIPSLAPGTYEIRATAKGYVAMEPARLEVREPRHEVEVRLGRAGRVRFRATGPDGVPLRDGIVWIGQSAGPVIFGRDGIGLQRPSNESLGTTSLSGRHDEEGYVAIDGLRPGANTLRFIRGGSVKEVPVTIPEGGTATVDLPVDWNR